MLYIYIYFWLKRTGSLIVFINKYFLSIVRNFNHNRQNKYVELKDSRFHDPQIKSRCSFTRIFGKKLSRDF